VKLNHKFITGNLSAERRASLLRDWDNDAIAEKGSQYPWDLWHNYYDFQAAGAAYIGLCKVMSLPVNLPALAKMLRLAKAILKEYPNFSGTSEKGETINVKRKIAKNPNIKYSYISKDLSTLFSQEGDSREALNQVSMFLPIFDQDKYKCTIDPTISTRRWITLEFLRKIQFWMPKICHLVDTTGGCGVDTINYSLSGYFKSVTVFEKLPERQKIIKDNIKVFQNRLENMSIKYGTEFTEKDIVKNNGHTVYLVDPMWKSKGKYLKKENYISYNLLSKDFTSDLKLLISPTSSVVLKIPAKGLTPEESGFRWREFHVEQQLTTRNVLLLLLTPPPVGLSMGINWEIINV
jgi:16S rRNA G966 N2-methylase RsmD